VAVGLVLDSERGYEYLTNDHAARWGVDAQELRRLATANLDAVSKEIAAQGIEKDDARAVVFATEDGYDAARILIPDLRAFIGTELGFPFLFAIPNRDFLICWTPGRSELDEFVRKQVREDYASMPYPLSSRIYRVTADNEIGQVD
jgi:uncharacterized protein YtpQ (UPF0354 family)